MTSLSRAPLRALVVAAAATLVLAGCGSSDDPKAAAAGAPTSAVAIPSPTVTFTDGPTQDPSDEPTGEPSDVTSATPTSADVQVVKVKKFGISFELPQDWISLDARKVLRGGGGDPFLEELAGRLGIPQEQLIQAFSSSLLTMSVSGGGASDGFLTNVNSVGQVGDLDDEQLKLQLATIGAKPGTPEHVATEAGDATRFPYDLTSKGITVRGLAVAVHTEDATVIITVSSASAAESARIGDQIQRSLRKLPDGAPGV